MLRGSSSTPTTRATELVGPPDPIVRQQIRELAAQAPLDEAGRRRIAGLEAREDLRLPITIHWNHAGRSATIDIGDNSIHLQQGEWSKWIDLDFHGEPLGPSPRHGAALSHRRRTRSCRLYVSPINWKPDAPPSPMSSPASLSADIYERLGPFRTLGWAEATWPLNEERIDEKAFMDDLYRAFDDRAQVILERLDAHAVGPARRRDRIDRPRAAHDVAAHRPHPSDVRPGARRAVRRLDRTRLPAVRRLRRRGALAHRPVDADPHRLGPRVPFVPPVGQPEHVARAAGLHDAPGADAPARRRSWICSAADNSGRTSTGRTPGRTRWASARSISTSRDARASGIVAPGAEARALEREIAAKLLTLIDPKTGARVVDAVYKPTRSTRGRTSRMPPSCRSGSPTATACRGRRRSAARRRASSNPNMKKWSGDHGSSDYQSTSGILISSRPIAAAQPDIMDIAPTVLKYFGLALPAEWMESRSSEGHGHARMHECTNARGAGAGARGRVAFRRAFVHLCICALPVALLAQQPERRPHRSARAARDRAAAGAADARPTISPPRNRRCSATCGGSRSSARSRPRS